MFADVIVDLTASDVDKIFEYSFDNVDCESAVQLGSRVLVPFGKKTIEGIVVSVKDKSVYPPEKIKPILKVIDPLPALTKNALLLSDYVVKNCFVTRALSLRLFLPSEMRKGKVKEKTVKILSIEDGVKVDEAEKVLNSRAVKQKEALNFIGKEKEVDFTFANETFGNQAIKALIERGFIKVKEEKCVRSPYENLNSVNKQIALTPAQQMAIDSIENTDKRVSLIFGVTGSGKTEVYLELIKRTINRGKTAVMLVPEIALTPQMLKQLRARFSNSAAILHSGLSAGERFDEWWRLRSGEAKIAIGARSAIFAPLEDIGLIIVDEEHDGSYKSESSPRYSTIDVAEYYSEISGAKLVLGSATPSVESFKRAKEGVYNLIELPERINKRPLPEVEIVDMRNEIKRGNNSPFSAALIDELSKCLSNKNQAMIFLNQRGYSKTVICTECGHVQKCEDCDVSLTYHKEDDSLLCHYCGAKYKMINACTECGSPFIRYGGVGTERVVIELNKLFPDAKILRMDRDTTKSKEGHFKILNEFSERNADILVGTQMIAKGHDFPSVTLVGILDADMSLHFSDYRSGERTFQLITQVAGRSGRANEAGKVVLQTYSPTNGVLIRAVNYDYLGFYEQEISIRKATAFPPFTDIVRVLVSGENEDATLDATKALYGEISLIYNLNKDKFFFFGCMKAPLKRLQNKFRYQVLMRINADDKKLISDIYSVSSKYNSRLITVALEVNPNNLT